MALESKTCQICFNDYLAKYERDHDCEPFWNCGACGESCEIEDGTVSMSEGITEFTHKPALCPAQDEIVGD